MYCKWRCDEMNNLQEEAKKKTAEWITKEYGPRCKVLAHGCPACDMWKLYDVLFAEYDGEYTWSKKIRNTPDNETHNDKDVVE